MTVPVAHGCYPRIDPVPDNVTRPFWSVMIPTYNRPNYLERALQSVLSQDPGSDEMQIEVIDNCSTTNESEEITRRLGKGRVSFYRQPRNVGATANFNTCISRSQGHWVHILHDDDVLLPGFYTAYREAIEQQPEVGLVFSRAISIDENDQRIQIMYTPPNQEFSGIVSNALYKLVIGNFIVCPSSIVLRRAYENLGGFDSSLSFSVDKDMWIRVVTRWPVFYIHRPSILYRLHQGTNGSGTISQFANGGVIEEMTYVADTGAARLPIALRLSARQRAYAAISAYAARIYRILVAHGRQTEAFPYALRSFQLRHSYRSLRLLLKALARQIHRNSWHLRRK